MSSKNQRRSFLKKFFWASGSVFLLAEACKPGESVTGPGEGPNGFSFGSGDIGLLNFVYTMSQLQAGFYTILLNPASMPSYLSADELSLMNDMLKHEIAQREFLKTALGSNALPSLQLDFSTLDLTNRASALQASIFFEDIGVQSINGLIKYMQTSAFSTIFGKMVSVQARHSAYIHEINLDGSFSGPPLVDTNGLEISQKPAAALALVHPAYVKTALDAGSLPNS